MRQSIVMLPEDIAETLAAAIILHGDDVQIADIHGRVFNSASFE